MDKVKVVSISVAAGLILAGIVGFLVYIEVVQQGVTMVVSDREVTVGELVNFTAEGGADDDSFRWEFGDGANATGREARHFYRAIGDYNATLSVHDGSSWSEVDETVITVTDLVFSLPAPRDGDAATYQLVGSVDVSNPDGIMNTQVGGHNVSLILAQLDIEGPLESYWTVSEAYDSFGSVHDAVEVGYRLDSVVAGKTYVRSEVGTTISDIAGDLWLNMSEFVDLDTNGSISTSVEGTFDSTQGILGSSGLVDENATLFRDLRIPSLLALAQAGVYGREYSMSMSSYSVPGVVSFEFIGPDSVDGRPAYQLRGTSPLAENATVDIWVSPSLHKLPRMAVSIVGSGNTTLEVGVDARLVSERRGESVIPYGECRQGFTYHLLPSRAGLETALQVQKRLMPADGTNETWYGLFTPRKAVEYAKAGNQTVSRFMWANDDSFAESASFATLPDGSRSWRIRLLTSQNATSITFTVVNDTGVISIEDVLVQNASAATQRPAAKSVVTFAAAERLLLSDPSLAPVFDGSDPSEWTMTYVKNLDLGLGDMAGLAALVSGLPSGESFFFARNDGTAYLAIDADNGAVTFIDISGTDISLFS